MENTAVSVSAKEKGRMESIFGLYFLIKVIITTTVVTGLIFLVTIFFLVKEKLR